MTVRITGDWCSNCQRLPALAHGLCAVCDRMARAFPRSEPEPTTAVTDPGWEAEFRAWREEAA